MERQWFETNPRIAIGMLAHCPPSNKWVPGGSTGQVKGSEERNWPPYFTMPMAQDKCPSKRVLPHRTQLYMGLAFTYTLFNFLFAGIKYLRSCDDVIYELYINNSCCNFIIKTVQTSNLSSLANLNT